MTINVGAKVCDYSYARPNLAKLSAAGYVAAGRYLHDTTPKGITRAEVADIHAAGMALFLYVERGAQRASGGYSAGAADIKAANALAKSLGVPAGVPLVFAVDYDAAPSTVLPYFDGLRSGETVWPVGGYGGYDVIEALAAHGVHWLVQTEAWSHRKVSAHAHILQLAGKDHPVPGIPTTAYDECRVLRAGWPWWTAHGVDLPDRPAHIPATTTTKDDIVSQLITVRPGHVGKATLDVQGLLYSHGHVHIACDGDYGPISQAAVKAVQKSAHITADGIVGPQTWRALLRLPVR